MKQITTTRMLVVVLMLIVSCALIGVGTFALFSDTASSSGNNFAAGNISIDVSPYGVLPLSYSNLKPGFTELNDIEVYNNGSLDGRLYMTISNVANDDNGCTEPEAADGDTSCGGDPDGELGSAVITMTCPTCPGPWGIPPGSYTVSDTVNNLEGVAIDLGVIPAGTSITQYLDFNVPTSIGNEIQSDKVTFDIEWKLVQETP